MTVTGVRPTHQRSEPVVIALVAGLAIVMAFGVEASLPAFDAIDADVGLAAKNWPTSLIVTSFLAGMGVGTLLWGPLADRFGRRDTLLVGLTVGVVGALATAAADDAVPLLIARALWGVGAAAPASLRNAIARDLFDGERLARVATIASAVFLVGPVLMPLVGEVILLVGTWRSIMVIGAGLLLAAAVAVIWFGETMDPGHRRPLDPASQLDGLRSIVARRSSLGAMAAAMFLGGAFFHYLGSAQPIIADRYDRAGWFAAVFAISGLVMSTSLVLNRWLIGRFGTRAVAHGGIVAFIGVAVVGVVAALASDGLPPFWVWVIWVCAANGLNSILTPVTMALALDPLGEQAGTGASMLGFAQLGPGAALAAVLDAALGETTITVMPVGMALYGGAALLAIRLGDRGDDATKPGPEPGPRSTSGSDPAQGRTGISPSPR